jgi:hypothetical protein
MLDEDAMLQLTVVITGKIATPRGVYHGILIVLETGRTRFSSIFLLLLLIVCFSYILIFLHVFFLTMARIM